MAYQKAIAQDRWFDEEIELCKLSSTNIIIFSYHPWFLKNVEDADEERLVSQTCMKPGYIVLLRFYLIARMVDFSIVPRHIRHAWLKKLRHKKVKYLFSTYEHNGLAKAYIRNDPIESIYEENNIDIINNASQTSMCEKSNVMKPSEIIAQAKDSGEIQTDDDESDKINTEGNVETTCDNDNSDDEKEKFLNEDLDYYGPFAVTTASLNLVHRIEGGSQAGLRIVRVYEDDVKHQFYELKNIPNTVYM